METDMRKSVPVVREFQIEGSWAPATPVKPILPRPTRIYTDGVETGLGPTHFFDSDKYLSTSLSMNMSTPGENVRTQCQSTEILSPHWRDSYGFANVATSSVGFGGLGLQSWVSRDPIVNVSAKGENSSDPLEQRNNMSFQHLLAMKGPPLEPLMNGALMNNNGSYSLANGYCSSGWSSEVENGRIDGSSRGLLFGDREVFHGLDQEINGRSVQEREMHTGGFPHTYWNSCDLSSLTGREYAFPNGIKSKIAPPTPDQYRKVCNKIASSTSSLCTDHVPDGQNKDHENEVAAAMVDLQELQCNKETQEVEENHNPDKGGSHIIDLNKTPQQKPRRRKYQPKVVREDKPKRTPKPKTPKNTENPRAKRKYVRKNKETPPSTNSPPEVAETNDPKVQEEAAKSCKRALDFDLENPAEADNGLNDSNSEPQAENSDSSNIQTGTDLQLRQGKQVDLEATQVGINGLVDTQSVLSVGNKKAEAEYEGNGKGDNEAQTGVAENNTEKTFEMGTNGVTGSQSCDINGSSNMVEQTKGSKRSYSCIETANLDNTHCTFWQPKHMFLGNLNINGISSILFPEIYKKKRTEKGQRSYTSVASSSAVSEDIDKVTHLQNPAMSKYYYCNPPQFNTFLAPNVQAKSVDSSNETRNQLLQTWADIARIKKKRSKGPTRVRNLSPLKGIAEDPVKRKRKYTRKQNAHTSDRTDSCMEFPLVDTSNGTDSCKGSLVVDTRTIPKTKKRSKKRSNVASSLDLVLYNSNQSSRNSGGALLALPWEEKVSIDMIIEKLIQLDINREGTPVSERALIPYHGKGQNALVVYGKDGTMVPFEGPFDPVKKRRPRAKVDLDGETERVWKLLLQSIDNQGIDGTDEEKAKWWEEERRVFRGRVDSFIARMRLVQGDRRFTPWKGSVLDSVIGVFLTQNVSDHLSSSAFMSMAAHFPVKSESEPTMFSEVTDILVEEPDVYITEPQERITWNKKVMDQQNCDGNSWKLHDVEDSEVKEVQNRTDLIGVSDVICKGDNGDKLLSESRMVRSSTYITEMESAINLGDDIAREDATSSQHSVLSSQNSVDSPSTQTAERMRAHSESNSEAEDLSNSSKPTYLDYSTSFVELLKIQETPLLHETYSGNNTWSYQMFESNPPETNAPKTSLEGQDISLIHSQLHLTTDFQLQDGKCADILEEGSRSSDTSMRKDKNSATELSDLTTESTVQCSAQEKILESTVRSPTVDMCSFYVLDGERMVMQTEKQPFKEQDTAASPVQGQSSSVWKNTNLSQFSQETVDFTESTSTSKGGIASECKELKQIPESTKPTKGKGAKDKQPAFDWDSLRKEAQRNGRKERTTNAMDSVDWEAVRCADVSQIADTIKERGMNNVLAGRIKDALNRLAREHGSVDLEWLRDIPPDKAKEYLLSIRGLGLKSVECIRLLTLHHLAFPVDTNVGRIAVRLGWVPLQPLPESLQLHLLEMYPVLESIQKYLWPRLCKLDQRTLYELHYHMITFGKVFCTKRQPNCNACPLRGECRHFASAFASARLALPGPEERSIMPSTQGIPTHQHPPVTINPLPLPPAPANQFSEMNSSINISDHIMGIQLSASSLPSLHGNLHSETKSEVRSSEPIIEVPASPEPEHSQTLEQDIEDAFYEDPNEIPTIKLNIEEFTQTLQNYMQGNMELQEGGMSRALVALTPEVASIPTPKLKNVNRLRTEHHVYELPDKHPLLHGLEKRESDDPCPYLLAIWTPGETANSIQPPERRCIAQDSGILCTEETCFYCNSQREANFQIVRGTLLIPCRTAMRGSFPLNGTYFQVNEVFADHDSSLNPIDVPREWLWNLPRRTVYFGTSIPTIFRGLTTDEIQHCFWRGFVCVRGFERKTRAPRPLMARLHFPASRMPRNRGKTNGPPEATM